jgi:hypothetical protein
MNRKTSKLLRKWCVVKDLPLKEAKRYWNRLTHLERGRFRKELQERLCQPDCYP